MRLDDLVEGQVYCDVNVFYSFLRSDPLHRITVRTFFKRMISGAVEVYLTPLVIDELFYRLLLAEVRESYQQNPLDILRTRLPEALASCSGDIRRALSRVIKLPHLHVVSVEATDLTDMFDNISAYSLLPRDALHLAVLQRLRLTNLATDDRDFDRVDWLQRHWIFNAPIREK